MGPFFLSMETMFLNDDTIFSGIICWQECKVTEVVHSAKGNTTRGREEEFHRNTTALRILHIL